MLRVLFTFIAGSAILGLLIQYLPLPMEIWGFAAILLILIPFIGRMTGFGIKSWAVSIGILASGIMLLQAGPVAILIVSVGVMLVFANVANWVASRETALILPDVAQN